MSADAEGILRIRLTWDGAKIRSVTIAPRRLLDPAQLVRGKTPDQAAQTLPLLYSLCGQAQGVAAQLALGAAQGDNGVSAAEARAVVAEAIRESAWHFLIDLPRHFGLPPAPQTLAQLRNEPEKIGERLEEILDCSGIADIPKSGEDAREASGSPALPDFDAEQIRGGILPALLNDAEFAVMPHWRGNPAETGAAARRGAGGMNAAGRLQARYEELPRLAAALRDDDTLSQLGWLKRTEAGKDAGLAWLQTSRGLLIHYARLENGTVSDYRIVAPTEWNFHPRGAYVRGLTGQPAGTAEEARRRAELLLLALDPCVGYEIGVDHA